MPGGDVARKEEIKPSYFHEPMHEHVLFCKMQINEFPNT